MRPGVTSVLVEIWAAGGQGSSGAGGLGGAGGGGGAYAAVTWTAIPGEELRVSLRAATAEGRHYDVVTSPSVGEVRARHGHLATDPSTPGAGGDDADGDIAPTWYAGGSGAAGTVDGGAGGGGCAGSDGVGGAGAQPLGPGNGGVGGAPGAGGGAGGTGGSPAVPKGLVGTVPGGGGGGAYVDVVGGAEGAIGRVVLTYVVAEGATPGAYAITGTATLNRQIVAEPGAFGIYSPDATFRPPVRITASAGVFLITGMVANAGNTFRLEAYLTPGPSDHGPETAPYWADLTHDVTGEIGLKWGQQGSGPLDRVATTGTLEFALRNDVGNSGGVVGYYSPRYAFRRPGWKTNVPTRLTLYREGVPFVKHRGWLNSIASQPGEQGAHPVDCASVDWIDQAARHKVRTLPTLTEVRADEVIQALADAMPAAIQPHVVDLDAGSEDFAFAMDAARGRTFLAEMSQATLSEYGYLYLRADGTLRFESRTARVGGMSPMVLIEAMHELDVAESQDTAANIVRVSIAPREADGSPVVLASLRSPIAIGPDQTVRVEFRYVDPDQRAAHVGGVDMITPVATTDFLFNALSNGTGADFTADLDVVAEFGGDSVTFTLTNNNVATGYVTLLQARGTGLYTYEPVTTEVRNQGSIDAGGERELSLAMPYQSDLNVAAAVAENLLGAWADPGNSISVTFLAEHSAEHLDCLYLRDVGDVVAVVEAVTGIAETYWIQGVEIRKKEREVTWLTWRLIKAEAGDYWELGVVGSSELGETTVMGPL